MSSPQNQHDAIDNNEPDKTIARSALPAQYNSTVPFQDSEFVPGHQLNGMFRLEKQLGRGGMGEAWKAYDETADRYVVLKFVPKEIQHVQAVVDSVRDSFRKVHELQHQHICPVYGLFTDSDYGLYLAMKFIDGIPLDEFKHRQFKKAGKMSFSDTVQILWGIAKGLDYAHEKKVIHRDIKPQNVMISKKDGVQIIDFGLADEIRTSMAQFSQVVMEVSGTRPYMAPEQWRGQFQDARTDQYALAVTAYELLSGHPPFRGSDVGVLRECVLKDSPEPIAGLPKYINAALFKGLAKKRDDRFPDCKSFVKALTEKPKAEPKPVPVEDSKKDVVEENIQLSIIPHLPPDEKSGEAQQSAWKPATMNSSKPKIVQRSFDLLLQKPLIFVTVAVLLAVLGVAGLFTFLSPSKQDEVQTIRAAESTDSKTENVEEVKTPAPTDLLSALKGGTVDEVKFFLDRGDVVDIDSFKKQLPQRSQNEVQGITPLHIAAWYNPHVEVLKLLVSRGADTKVKTANGLIPLNFAARNPNVEITKYIVSLGVNVQEIKNAFRDVLSHNSNLDVFRYFIAQGADVNIKGYKSFTPLHVAAHGNPNVEIMKFLLSQGADVNAKDEDGKTPLDHANSEEKRQLLRAAGAKFGSYHSVLMGGNVDEVKFFLDRGDQLDIEAFRNRLPSEARYEADGMTPLHVAAWFNPHVEVVKYLISQRANTNAPNINGSLPLQFAARNPNLEVMKYLLSLDTDPQRIKNNQWIFMDAAILNPNVEVLQYLTDHGADINFRGYMSGTPLVFAAQRNPNPEVLTFLISQGADIYARDDNGATALRQAKTEEKRQILLAALRGDSIFDGKTLNGWKNNETYQGFKVENGCIAGFGPRNHLYYMEELKNFELMLDVKINKEGNSGIYVKSKWEEGVFPSTGVECQINGSGNRDPARTGSVYHRKDIFETPHGDDEWFNYHIICRGNTLEILVNGKLVNTYEDPKIDQKGYIALQQLRDTPPSTPMFKNIFLKKLPD